MSNDRQPALPEPAQALPTPSSAPVMIYVPAGFWRRVLAAQIDFFVFCLVFAFAACILQVLLPFSISPGAHGASLLYPALICLYAGWAESSHYGATVGKRFLHLTVQGPGGARLSVGRSAVRQLLRLATFFMLPFAFLWIALPPKKRGLHDLAVQAHVVRRLLYPEPETQEQRAPGEARIGRDRLTTVLVAVVSILLSACALYGAALMILKGLARQGMAAGY